MNNHPLLVENEGKRLNIRLPLLICFAMFAAWQMGMVYFSGKTLSLDGRTTLPVNIDNFTIFIAAGYILSILVMIFLPFIIVWTERITAGVALLSALALFLPLSSEALTQALYLQFFCCCFMIGFETAVIVGLFTEKTAVLHLTAAYGVANFFVAALQNDFIDVTFSVFRLFAVFALTLMLIFFFKLPAGSWPRSVKKADGLIAPKPMFAGVFLWTGMSCFVILFGNAASESVTHGIFTYYTASAISAFIVFFLWKYFSISPFRSVHVMVALGAMGFVVKIASLHVPSLSLAACALLGAGSMGCWVNPLFGSILISKRYPSRFVSPGIIGVAFITVLIHSLLLDALRDNINLLHIVYLTISMAMVILYFILEPYLIYSFHSRTFQDIIGVVAEEPITENPATLQAAPMTETAAPADEPLHQRRMKILMTHTLSPLTRREYQVADCIMRGLRRSETAQEMGVLPETITKYTNQIYSKFGIHRRQDLFRLAEKLDREWLDD